MYICLWPATKGLYICCIIRGVTSKNEKQEEGGKKEKRKNSLWDSIESLFHCDLLLLEEWIQYGFNMDSGNIQHLAWVVIVKFVCLYGS